MSNPDITIPVVEVQEPDDFQEEPEMASKKSEPTSARPTDSKIQAQALDMDDELEEDRPTPTKKDPHSTSSSSGFHAKPQSSSSSSNSKHYDSKQHKSSKSSKYHSSSYAYHHPPRDYNSSLDIGASLSREFRGTSPSVIENIATHPLLHSGGFEPLRHPTLSARSRKAFRDASDLVYTAPGLKNLLEVC
ncbi:catchin protein [Elysia marginata]|uniref:Catchin protein n=1 Tax=Elysia marginata TaxID=1093978 RepID=A0AAV4HZV2_9GAST|nr:catchin protein [Elysia marginata]